MAAGVQAESQRRAALLGGASGLWQLGAGARGIEGQQRAEDFGQWQAAQPWASPWWGQAQMALGTPANTLVSQPGSSPFGQALQGFGAGMSAYNQMFPT